MANASFTRDEAILALDVLYRSSGQLPSANSEEIKELCGVLQELPIHPKENRRVDFRNESGVRNQLALFKKSFKKGEKDPNVGAVFYSIAIEFENNLEELHRIANGIRKNVTCFNNLFGSDSEDEGFPEGVLLGHAYRVIERRDGKKCKLEQRCSICQIEPDVMYQKGDRILEAHLIVDPCDIVVSKKYSARCFITVCPTCHAALHKYRPWLKKNDCSIILRR
ncbi:MAG: hypothetical protein II873_04760 [Oscillospiraceae bacterium]|nr:hypothetical protein [Oscillospiraceae bacterium]